MNCCLSRRLANGVSDKHFRCSDSGVKSCFICKLNTMIVVFQRYFILSILQFEIHVSCEIISSVSWFNNDIVYSDVRLGFTAYDVCKHLSRVNALLSLNGFEDVSDWWLLVLNTKVAHLMLDNLIFTFIEMDCIEI